MAILEVLTVEEHNTRVEGRPAPPRVEVGKRYRFIPKVPQAWTDVKHDRDGYVRGKVNRIIGDGAFMEVRNVKGFVCGRFVAIDRLEAI